MLGCQSGDIGRSERDMASQGVAAEGRPLRRSARNRHTSAQDIPDGTSSTSRQQKRQRAPAKASSSSSQRQPVEPVVPDQQAGPPEDIGEDDLCPICQQLLYRPVTTRCNHTMCESCMAHWADVSVMSQMKIVDVDEEPEAFNAVSGLEARCPMCRTQTTAHFNQDYFDRLASNYPNTSHERSVEEKDSFGQQGSIQTLTVYIGNRHQEVQSDDANVHEWIFFVKPSRTDIIEEVQLVLHPTFRPNRVIRQRAPYEVKRLGWGTFTLTAYVILKAGYTWMSSEAENSPDGASKGMLPLEWDLDFTSFGGKGSMGSCRLKVKNDREWHDVSDDREWQRVVRSYQRDGVYEPPEEE